MRHKSILSGVAEGLTIIAIDGKPGEKRVKTLRTGFR